VTEASDPSLIKWSNLGVKKKNRVCYTCLTNFTATILVLITFYAVAMIQQYKFYLETGSNVNFESNYSQNNGWSPKVCD
jgi:hypothetical protein